MVKKGEVYKSPAIIEFLLPLKYELPLTTHLIAFRQGLWHSKKGNSKSNPGILAKKYILPSITEQTNRRPESAEQTQNEYDSLYLVSKYLNWAILIFEKPVGVRIIKPP